MEDTLAEEFSDTMGRADVKKTKKRIGGLSYIIDENPPWYLCILLGFQHYLTMLGGNLAVPFALSVKMCFDKNDLAMSEVMGTVFFTSGLATLLQTTFGVRLPIIQGSTFTFITPAIAILSLPEWKCPDASSSTMANSTIDFNEIWKPRMCEIQGAIMVSSLFQVVIGFSGLMGILLRFIGPIAIAPTIILIGLALFEVAAFRAGSHWGISMMTIALIALFSQYMYKIRIPVPGYKKERGFYCGRYPIFRLFPIILAICVSWIVCLIVTEFDGFPSNSKSRTDTRYAVLQQAKWFRLPYPGQWGTPTVSVAAVFGMLAGVIASIVESVGDYYACARMSGAPPPPRHAINRGIGMEGIGCIITGAWGTGSGTTSYSENIGAIGITKVGSRRVIQIGGCVALVMGVVGKIGALFTTIPDPIVGGVFMVMFGMIIAVGISNLQFVDMNSARNMFIVGVSIVFGMALPFYLKTSDTAIKTGNKEVDQIFTVLLTTNIAVGGLLALFLDNTIPGTAKERGLIAWRQNVNGDDSGESDGEFLTASIHVYDLPFCLKKLSNMWISRYLPYMPFYPPERRDNLDHIDSAANVAIVLESIPTKEKDGSDNETDKDVEANNAEAKALEEKNTEAKGAKETETTDTVKDESESTTTF